MSDSDALADRVRLVVDDLDLDPDDAEVALLLDRAATPPTASSARPPRSRRAC